MFNNNEFILASSSKSRLKILKNTGLNFLVKKPICNEEKIKKKLKEEKHTPMFIVRFLAREKAKSISKKYKEKTTIGCDTIILFKNKIIDKSKNKKSAIKTLKMLSGQKHTIISSIAAYKNNKKTWEHTSKTIVKIRKLNNELIHKYIKICGPQLLNSVGCYQIEALGPIIIENIKGDFFNVMGFPLFPFLKFLKREK